MPDITVAAGRKKKANSNHLNNYIYEFISIGTKQEFKKLKDILVCTKNPTEFSMYLGPTQLTRQPKWHF